MIHQNSALELQDTEDRDRDPRHVSHGPRLDRERDSSAANLDDYIYELENRTRTESKLTNNCQSKESVVSAMSDNEDLLIQLQQKEKDLILAAELGKALLDKNEELSRANEKIAEEFSHKLEVIKKFSINLPINQTVANRIDSGK